MPQSIRALLVINDKLVHYRIHNGLYQARYRRDGYNIEVAAKDFQTMKQKFLARLASDTPHKSNKAFPLLSVFTTKWLQDKKYVIKESTWDSYEGLITTHVIPTFGDKKVNELTRAEIQDYLFNLIDQEKFRTAQKLKQVLSAIFDVVAEDFDIKSPMKKIALPHYEAKKGRALTKEEEKTVVDYCIAHKDAPVNSAILLLLYTGMRVGELASAVLHENHIVCETLKIRKGYEAEYRKIPISPMLEKVMPYINFNAAVKLHRDYVYRNFQKILPNRYTHELRYTFITRAKEAGCNFELVMLWDGHKYDEQTKTSRVDRGYTTYSDEYYFGEIKKIDYEL